MYALDDFVYGAPSEHARERFKDHVAKHFPSKTATCFCRRPSTFTVAQAMDKLDGLTTRGIPGLSYVLSTDPERPDRIVVTIDAFGPSRPVGRQDLQAFDMSAEAIALMPSLELLMTLAVDAGAASSRARERDRHAIEIAGLEQTWSVELEPERDARAKAEARVAELAATNARLDAELHRYLEAGRSAAVERKRLEREAQAAAAEAFERSRCYQFPEAGDVGFSLGDIIGAFRQAIAEVGSLDVRWKKDGLQRVRFQNKSLAAALRKRGVGQRVMVTNGGHGYRIYFFKTMVDRAIELLQTKEGSRNAD